MTTLDLTRWVFWNLDSVLSNGFRSLLTVLQEAPVMHGDLVPILGLLVLLAPDLLGDLHLKPGLGEGLGPSEPQSRHNHIH